jgi:hypothetical protein
MVFSKLVLKFGTESRSGPVDSDKTGKSECPRVYCLFQNNTGKKPEKVK